MEIKVHKKNIISLSAPLAIGVVFSFLSLSSSLYISTTAHAASVKGFQAGNIIDNAVFRNNGSMSTAQIQTFLNNKNSVCLKNYKGLALVDTNGNGQVEDWTTAERYGGKTGKAKMSAAELIKAASDIYKINPQVFLVTLQKEQGLITGTNCANMGTAFGYGCPDTAACDPAAMGFTRQIDNAGYHFRGYYQDSLTYVPFTKGTYTINYNPIAKCGGKKVVIQNEATGALYSYTPYQPNKYALNGGSDPSYPNCGAFGNRNFYTYFTEWFGSTYYTVSGSIGAKYSDAGGIDGLLGLPTMNKKCGLASGGCYQSFEGGSIYWSSSSGANIVKGSIRSYWGKIGAEESKLGYPIAEEKSTGDGGWYQKYENGYILGKSSTGYWESTGGIRAYWGTVGYQAGSLGYPVGSEKRLQAGGWYQKYENGYILGKKSTGYWESMGQTRDRWLERGYQDGQLGYPTSAVKCILKDSGCYQKYENGAIIGKPNTGYWESMGNIRVRWAALGYENSSTGYPTGPEKSLNGGGWYQKYENGYILGKSSTGYWESYGATRDRWSQLGYQNGSLGYPTGAIICGIKDSGCYQKYQNGAIIGKPNTGYWESMGAIRARWKRSGYQDGSLGYPTGAVTHQTSKSSYQQYESNKIYHKSPNKTWIAP